MAVGNDRNLEQHSVIRRANVRSAFFKNNNCRNFDFHKPEQKHHHSFKEVTRCAFSWTL